MNMNITKEQLEYLYIEKGLTVRQCAAALGMPTHGPMSWFLKKHNIKTRVGKFQKGNQINKGRSLEKHPGWKGGKQSVQCDACGKYIIRFPSLIKGNNFCNQSCYSQWKKESFTGENNPNYGSTAMVGDGNPNWKGGIALEPYCQIWGDREYKESIKERDDFKCQNPDCWDTSQDLVLHHIDYNKKNCHPDNLITLCVSCNIRANYRRESWKTFYKDLTLT